MECELAPGGLNGLLTAANRARAIKQELDLTCHETLPAPALAPTPAPALAPLVTASAPAGAVTTPSQAQMWTTDDPKWNPHRVDTFYWEKQHLLRTMLKGFVGMMVRKFDEHNAKQPPAQKRPLIVCRLYHEKRADMPPGTLKTFEDLELLDKQIGDMVRMHSRVVRSIVSKKRARWEENQQPEAKAKQQRA